ncbi:hypothetical protein ABZX93_24635 [Streptomyces sp. NPDC006632]|uniref:hypothetical protein n=1 Tax=Streptomyces sp. NPDC006632 TaxID=3157182 RepID=UPI0033A8B342
MSSTEGQSGTSGPALEGPPVPGTPEHGPSVPGTPEHGPSVPGTPVPGPSDPAAVEGDVTGPAAQAPGRRPRGRVVRLIAAAAVLGVVAGTVTGYVVQYQRQPTPLAPLARQDLAESRTTPAGKNTTARTVSANRWDEKSDGDLRRLLVPKPDAAKSEEKPRWEDLVGMAALFEHPDAGFTGTLRDGFRRRARTSWSLDGHAYVTVVLTQFHDDDAVPSKRYVQEQQDYLPDKKYAGNPGKPIPGNTEGRTYVFDKPNTEPGYKPMYEGVAYAWRDGIVMEIEYDDFSGAVPESALQALAKQQLERL